MCERIAGKQDCPSLIFKGSQLTIIIYFSHYGEKHSCSFCSLLLCLTTVIRSFDYCRAGTFVSSRAKIVFCQELMLCSVRS